MSAESEQAAGGNAPPTRLMKNAHRWVPEGRSPMLLAVVALAVSFAARYALQGVFGTQFRFVFFSAAAALVCAYGGIWPASLVALGGLLLAFYFFIEPFNSFGMPNVSDITVIAVYLVDTAIMLVLIEWLQRSKYEIRLYMLESKHRSARLEELVARMEKAERDARHHEQRIHVLAAGVPEIWHLRTADGSFEFVNGKLYDLTGLPPGALEGEKWTKSMHPNDAELARDISARVEATGKDEEIGVRLRLPDGSYERFDAECRCVNDELHGRIVVWSGAVSEVEAEAN